MDGGEWKKWIHFQENGYRISQLTTNNRNSDLSFYHIYLPHPIYLSRWARCIPSFHRAMIRQRDDRADFIVQFYWYCSQYQNFYLLENVVWFLEPYIQKTSFSLLEEWKMRFSCKKVCPSIFQHPLRGSKLLLASGRKTDAETRVARYPMTNPSIAIHI